MGYDIILRIDEFIERFVVIGQKSRSANLGMSVKAKDAEDCHYADDEEDAEGSSSTIVVNSDGLFLKKRGEIGLFFRSIVRKS